MIKMPSCFIPKIRPKPFLNGFDVPFLAGGVVNDLVVVSLHAAFESRGAGCREQAGFYAQNENPDGR